jgi:hypothetical protein
VYGANINDEKIRQRQVNEPEKEPWLLATYLNKTLNLSKKIVKTYATRMQIEESFRDVKKKG